MMTKYANKTVCYSCGYSKEQLDRVAFKRRRYFGVWMVLCYYCRRTPDSRGALLYLERTLFNLR